MLTFNPLAIYLAPLFLNWFQLKSRVCIKAFSAKIDNIFFAHTSILLIQWHGVDPFKTDRLAC